MQISALTRSQTYITATYAAWQDGRPASDTLPSHTHSTASQFLEYFSKTHIDEDANSHGAVGVQLGAVSCNWISLYFGSVAKVKRPEAFSNRIKTMEAILHGERSGSASPVGKSVHVTRRVRGNVMA